MNRIEFSRQTAEAVPLHAPVSGLPTSAPDVPVLLPRHETSGLRRTVQWRFLRPIIDAVGLTGALVLANALGDTGAYDRATKDLLRPREPLPS